MAPTNCYDNDYKREYPYHLSMAEYLGESLYNMITRPEDFETVKPNHHPVDKPPMTHCFGDKLKYCYVGPPLYEFDKIEIKDTYEWHDVISVPSNEALEEEERNLKEQVSSLESRKKTEVDENEDKDEDDEVMNFLKNIYAVERLNIVKKDEEELREKSYIERK